ncbi:hypothetical protein BBD42_01540 [Paenibacillus sp. BIHB 4019]|uniref:Uncharacterized protein n=1 Tax=Paenibacillus sp. BIHB 4019 TaxID=1870819 RepID=A0A1B2DC80_9BACL|nr:hypothetical protein BBD42_01540 [Paenibacillus sp. BIHB 4019]
MPCSNPRRYNANANAAKNLLLVWLLVLGFELKGMAQAQKRLSSFSLPLGGGMKKAKWNEKVELEKRERSLLPLNFPLKGVFEEIQG